MSKALREFRQDHTLADVRRLTASIITANRRYHSFARIIQVQTKSCNDIDISGLHNEFEEDRALGSKEHSIETNVADSVS